MDIKHSLDKQGSTVRKCAAPNVTAVLQVIADGHCRNAGTLLAGSQMTGCRSKMICMRAHNACDWSFVEQLC